MRPRRNGRGGAKGVDPVSEIFDKQGRSVAGGVGSKARNPGGQSGNQNAAKRGNDTVLTVACTRREKAAWVKAAPGKLAEWVRDNLNAAAE